MLVLFRLVLIISVIVILLLSIRTTEFFMTLPETNRFKSILAFDIVVLWITSIVLIIKLMIM